MKSVMSISQTNELFSEPLRVKSSYGINFFLKILWNFILYIKVDKMIFFIKKMKDSQRNALKL